MQQLATVNEPAQALCTPEQAFLTDDSEAVLRFACDALNAGMAAVLVTLVGIHGGAARSLGAHMAVREDGRYCGFVSGGCVESAVAHEALLVMSTGVDRTVRYGVGSPYFDIVLPCGGGITLALYKLRDPQPLIDTLSRLSERKPAGLRYASASQTLISETNPVKTDWDGTDFVVSYRPCVRVMVFGRSLEAQAAANLARAVGYDVQTSEGFNPKTSFALMDEDTAVIMLYHDLNRELPVLQAALAARPFYIGALGSKRTHEARVKTLTGLGVSAEDIARIKAPIGIFAKARDAHSLALSVLADVAAARLARCAR